MNRCKCGTEIPNNQNECYMCWRMADRKQRPNQYCEDKMFAPNGVTKNTKTWDKWRSTDKFNGGYVS